MSRPVSWVMGDYDMPDWAIQAVKALEDEVGDLREAVARLSNPDPTADRIAANIETTLGLYRRCAGVALRELGVPSPEYPANVANAVAALEQAGRIHPEYPETFPKCLESVAAPKGGEG